jgi:hypothetical protein
MKKILFILNAMLLMMSGANAATDEEKKHCLQYDKQPRCSCARSAMEKLMTRHPKAAFPFPLLVLDQPICTWGPIDESEFLQWALHIADKCARA